MGTAREQWYTGLQRHGVAVDSQGLPDWPGSQSLLDAAAAAADEPAHSPAEHALLIDIGSLAVMDVDGVDAGSFLQAQFCNDLNSLPLATAQLNGYCSPKGRLLALFTIYPTATGFRLVLPAAIVDGFIQRLAMYVLRASVQICRRDDLLVLGLCTRAPALGSTLLPETPWQMRGDEHLTVIRYPGALSGAPRYLLVAGAVDALALLDTLPPEAVLCAEPLWRLGDIQAGIPRIDAATRELFIPQMVNLQAIDGLSFRKGCYPGQEIIARMQYLGKLKRHMRRFRVTADAAEAAGGDALYTSDGAEAGRIVDCVSAGGALHLLAVTQDEHPLAALRLHDRPLKPVPLPYPLATIDAAHTDRSASGDRVL